MLVDGAEELYSISARLEILDFDSWKHRQNVFVAY